MKNHVKITLLENLFHNLEGYESSLQKSIFLGVLGAEILLDYVFQCMYSFRFLRHFFYFSPMRTCYYCDVNDSLEFIEILHNH